MTNCGRPRSVAIGFNMIWNFSTKEDQVGLEIWIVSSRHVLSNFASTQEPSTTASTHTEYSSDDRVATHRHRILFASISALLWHCASAGRLQPARTNSNRAGGRDCVYQGFRLPSVPRGTRCPLVSASCVAGRRRSLPWWWPPGCGCRLRRRGRVVLSSPLPHAALLRGGRCRVTVGEVVAWLSAFAAAACGHATAGRRVPLQVWGGDRCNRRRSRMRPCCAAGGVASPPRWRSPGCRRLRRQRRVGTVAGWWVPLPSWVAVCGRWPSRVSTCSQPGDLQVGTMVVTTRRRLILFLGVMRRRCVRRFGQPLRRGVWR